MSWQMINQMLGLAVIDANFSSRLLADPLLAARELGFDLTEEEQRVLRHVKARDIVEMSQVLAEKFGGPSNEFPIG